MKNSDLQNDRRTGERRVYDRRKQDRKGKPRFDWKYLIIVAIVGAVIFLWIRINGREEQSIAESAVPVRIIYPEKGDIRKTLSLSGYVESESLVTILPKISGTLIRLNVETGDYVEKGEIIAEIDSEPYELTLKQAEAALFAAQSTFERMEQLYNANAASRQNYDQAKSQYDASRYQYELAQLNFQYTRIESPVSGVVLQKHTSVGSLVASQVPLITVGDLTNLTITAKVPEKHYSFFARNKKDLAIEAELPALDGETVNASVRTVSPYVSPETKTFEVVCILHSRSEFIRPGMFVNLNFVLDSRKDIYRLPYDTLVGENTLWYVDEENCRARKLEYAPPFHDSRYFQVDEEYSDTPFIIEGQFFIREGNRCRVLNSSGFCSGDEMNKPEREPAE